MQGKIIKGIAGFYYVYGADKMLYECKAKGIFRKDNQKPLVGDNVEITGKKTARVLSETEAAGETEEPETTADGAISLSPVNSGQEKETEGSTAALAYILYE